MPVIGLLNPTSPDTNADALRAFRQGLKDTDYMGGPSLRDCRGVSLPPGRKVGPWGGPELSARPGYRPSFIRNTAQNSLANLWAP
jgi:hypothetical protein